MAFFWSLSVLGCLLIFKENWDLNRYLCGTEMKATIILFVLTILTSCSNKRTEKMNFPRTPKIVESQKATTFDEVILLDTSAIDEELPKELNISAIDAKFPLRINQIDVETTKKGVKLEKNIVSRIKQTVKDYADKIGFYDNSTTYDNAYINTIRLQDSAQTIFLVLLKNPYPPGKVNSQVLFYDNEKKKFADKLFDFNLFALYDYHKGKLTTGNLKANFKITSPEIELVDFDKNGISDYQFTRLFHNGTSNHIYVTILTIQNSKVVTLNFDSQEPNEWSEKN